MTYFIVTLVAIYLIVLFLFSKTVVTQIKQKAQDEVNAFDKKYLELEKKKNSLYGQKMALEEEALQIFTLYDITKEITKNLRREDAIEAFQKKLKEHVLYEECLFIEPHSREYKNVKESKEYFLFILQDKRKKIGFLALKGVDQDDYENINILGHQFALALRRVELYQELERIAITDGLTELNTRRHTLERLDEEFARSQARNIKLSFLMVDVDYFKRYNDQYGHLTGDQILREIGFIIKDNIREIDIAGRYGGEEFCVILPDTNQDGAQYAAERIRQAAENALIKVYDAKVNITVSIGVATYPDHAKKADELIDKADWALYRAKKQGRNRICSFGQYSKE